MLFHTQYDAALALASLSHRNQVRKGSDIPYSTHVVHVAAILERGGFEPDVVAAGLLHDAPEDTGLAQETIASVCGNEVARIVAALTETKTDAAGTTRPWLTRKEERLAKVQQAGSKAVAVAAADALHNICTTIADVEREGSSVWSRFKQPERLVWYYRQIEALAQEMLPGHVLTRELSAAIEQLQAMHHGL
jgi:(p)ppGpp synthase/HD superfamily hydrolase